MLKLRTPVALLMSFVLAAFMIACSAITPTNFTESLLLTETAATTARQTGEQLALAGKVNKSQAQFIQNQADLVVAGVKSARELRLTSPTTAQQQLDMTRDILTALQRFLAQQGASK